MTIKVLNLYAGIGGNRKLWTDVEVTAVELDPKIAAIYQAFFPNDKVIVADAHQYLLEHFGEFDFIWSSPPCPTHSRLNHAAGYGNWKNPFRYPDMKLYEEIIFLKHYFKGKFVVENVISFYEPLYPPLEICDHYFWTNFFISNFPSTGREHDSTIEVLAEKKGVDMEKFNKYTGIDKRKILRNCVQPHLGLHILNESKRDVQPSLFGREETTSSKIEPLSTDATVQN